VKAEESLLSLCEEQKVTPRAHQETAEPRLTFQLDGGLALSDSEAYSEALVFMTLPLQPQLEKVTVSGTGVEIGRETGAAPAKSVETNSRLNMDFSAGPSGSVERKVLIKDAKQDLAGAAGVASSGCNIRSFSPGSVPVAVNAPEKAAFFAKTSLDPNPKLGSGRFAKAPIASVTGVSDETLTRPPGSRPYQTLYLPPPLK